MDENNAERQINSRIKRVENQELEQLEQLIMMDNTFKGQSKIEKEWVEAKLGLLLFIKNDLLDDGIHTIYGKLPQDWELL